MRKARDGTFSLVQPKVHPGARYQFLLDGDGPFPDPWSRWQPDGVHGASAVLVPLRRDLGHRPVPRGFCQATYELHLGTLTREGTYRAAIKELPRLQRLGVDTLQLMPVAEWPGRWNWGYDGAYFYAPAHAYGTPDDLRALVGAAHRQGLSIILDVVYNHLGPDGAYIHRFAPEFFTNRFKTPWGGAVDYSRPEVRRTVFESTRWWVQEYGFDGFRLDATHAIHDPSRTHILADVARSARRAYRSAYLVAEDHRNLRDLVSRHGLDAILADDFHHALRVLLLGERDHYFANYRGRPEEIARAIQEGWIHQGGRTGFGGPGTPTTGLAAQAFVFCLENHDQVGNRGAGHHLASLVTPAQYRAASCLLLLVPERVMLFQGQEFASSGSFLFFTDHNAELGRLVTEGRRREFRSFREYREHPERLRDPQSPETFQQSKMGHDEAQNNAWCLRLYRELLQLRTSDPVLRRPDRKRTRAWVEGEVIYMERRWGRERRLLAVTLKGQPGAAIPAGRVLLHSEERRFGGGGRPTLESPGAVLLA